MPCQEAAGRCEVARADYTSGLLGQRPGSISASAVMATGGGISLPVNLAEQATGGRQRLVIADIRRQNGSGHGAVIPLRLMSGDDRPKIEQPYEVLGTSRRYVLGEIPEGYGIWDSLAGNQLVERFPLTEDGLDLAMERFDELKGRDRREGWNLFRVVWIATVTGVVLWLVAGTLAAVLFGFGAPRSGLGLESSSR